MRVVVAFSPGPREVEAVTLDLAMPCSAREAVVRSGLAARHEAVRQWIEAPTGSALTLALRGRHCDPARPLREGDRVELLRPLAVDPKDARRQRVQAQRSPPRSAQALSGNPKR